jgi:uncharacterized protein (DUF58 family)
MRLTRLGVAVLVAAAVLLAVGLLLGWPPVTALGVGCLTAVGLAAFVVAESPNVEARRWAGAPEVARGSQAQFSVALISHSNRRPRPLTALETVNGSPRLALIPPLRGGERHSISYEVTAHRRGVITVGPIVVTRTDPFGLVLADRALPGTSSVSVRPRRYDMRMLPSGRRRDLEGPTRERSEGTAAFHQLRPYTLGDDPRRIHWRSTARAGEPIVRQMVDTTRPELVVVVDNRIATCTADDFEHAVEIAASVLRAAENAGYPTTLRFTDGDADVVDPSVTTAHLDRLTTVQQQAGATIAPLAGERGHRGRSLMFITGHLAAADLVALGTLALGFDPAYLVSVMSERTVPLVAPPGMRAVACASGPEFVAYWEQSA